MARPTRALICRTVHDDPDRRWSVHVGMQPEEDPPTHSGRIAQRRDNGTGLRKYAPTWEAALAAAYAHLTPEERTIETTLDPLPEAQRFAETLNRVLANRRPLEPGRRRDVAYHATVDRNGRTWYSDPNRSAHRGGLAFDPAYFAEQPDTPDEPGQESTTAYTARRYGKTAEERHLEEELDAALARAQELEQQQLVTLEVEEELASQLEKVEQERDHLATVLAATARQRDEADKRSARPLTRDAIESVLHDILPLTTEHLKADDIANIASDLHLALTDPTRPPTADDIPVREFEAMADRALARWDEAKTVWAPRDAMREAMRAALTEPPRPVGAGEIEAILDELPDTNLPITDAGRADLLAERGVRVTGAES